MGALAWQVPFESLRRTARDRKGVLDEVYSVVSTLKSSSSSDGPPSQQEAAVALDAAVSRLQSLKRKVSLTQPLPRRGSATGVLSHARSPGQ